MAHSWSPTQIGRAEPGLTSRIDHASNPGVTSGLFRRSIPHSGFGPSIPLVPINGDGGIVFGVVGGGYPLLENGYGSVIPPALQLLEVALGSAQYRFQGLSLPTCLTTPLASPANTQFRPWHSDVRASAFLPT